MLNQDQEKNRTGRRALFIGTGSATSPDECISVSEITEIIRQINSGEQGGENKISPIFEPVIQQITDLTRKADYCDAECRKLTDKLLKSEEIISVLKDEKRELSSERESYLNDLITSHTEFDRALEIFQYHDVPMALTGPDRTVHDVNDAFCNLFSIVRSQITSSHPPLSTYLPDDRSVIGPDKAEYVIITLTPPIVPFDHEAVSLVSLIKASLLHEIKKEVPEETAEDISQGLLKPVYSDITSEAFEQFPLPAAIINEYRTIVRCNAAFSQLVAREKEIIQLRDIGSCGISHQDTDCINELLADNSRGECNARITHPDGSEVHVYMEIIPIHNDQDNHYALIIGAVEDDEEESQEIERGRDDKVWKPSDNTLFRMLLDLNPSATALLDTHARVVSANEGFSEITGLSPGDLFGTDVRDLGIPVPDSVLSSDATDAEYLPGIIRIQSPWGIQESSGMLVPTGSIDNGIVAILVLQPAQEPAEIKTVSAPDSDAPVKNSKPDPDQIPVPHLLTNESGRITRINNAFTALTGIGSGQIEGHQIEDLIKPDSEGLMRITLPTGEFRVREIMNPEPYDDGQKGYWYFDLSSEVEKITQLESRIKSLNSELDGIRDQQQSSTVLHSEKGMDQIDIVEFELNNERYAIDITMVREVVEMLPITPLPRTPPYVIGIINLRGEVTHVIDLAILLGERPKKDRSGQKIMIIPSDVTHGDHVGIIVDNVQSVTEILGKHVSLLGDDITNQIQTHIKGIIKISHDDVLEKHTEVSREATLVIWLDIQKILDEIQGTI